MIASGQAGVCQLGLQVGLQVALQITKRLCVNVLAIRSISTFLEVFKRQKNQGIGLNDYAQSCSRRIRGIPYSLYSFGLCVVILALPNGASLSRTTRITLPCNDRRYRGNVLSDATMTLKVNKQGADAS